ncbi:unnamed protein product [Rhizopus stolonifer]
MTTELILSQMGSQRDFLEESTAERNEPQQLMSAMAQMTASINSLLRRRREERSVPDNEDDFFWK